MEVSEDTSTILPTKGRLQNVLPELHEGSVRIAIIGESGSGKTQLAFKLIRDHLYKYFARFILVCPSAGPEAKANVWDFVEWSAVYPIFNPEHQQQLLDWIPDDGYHTLVVYDDCISEDHFHSDSAAAVLNKLVHRGRHKLISFMVLTQVYKGISSQIRSEVQYFYVFGNMIFPEVEKIQKELGPSSKEQYKIFPRILDENLPTKHSWVLYDKEKKQWFNGTTYKVIPEISRVGENHKS